MSNDATVPSAESPTFAEVRATESSSSEERLELSAATIESSTPFVGRWNELISTTNWEKGRLIAEWRAELERSGAAVTEYSDEAWARLVGGVTSQHVGRLRRAHDRFGGVYEQYGGLYWSHFQAALEWNDAEMWLEGAVTHGWSVSQMRAGRWEAVGGPSAAEAEAARVIDTQIDEDSYSNLIDRDGPGDSDTEDAPFDEAPRDAAVSADPAADAEPAPAAAREDDPAPVEPVRPFEGLGSLPHDVAEAFEQMKLAILTHKLTGWEQIRLEEMLGALESLRALALAPSET